MSRKETDWRIRVCPRCKVGLFYIKTSKRQQEAMVICRFCEYILRDEDMQP